MKFEGSKEINVNSSLIWGFLTNPTNLAECLPDAKSYEVVDDKTIKAKLKIGISFIKDTVTLSFDEKPGVQAISMTSKELPPVPGKHPSVTRDYEYRRLGTLSLLAGIDMHTGIVTEIVSRTHNSDDFIEFLRKLDISYPKRMKIRVILENLKVHTSEKTREYLLTVPNRFEFVFTPKHGS